MHFVKAPASRGNYCIWQRQLYDIEPSSVNRFQHFLAVCRRKSPLNRIMELVEDNNVSMWYFFRNYTPKVHRQKCQDNPIRLRRRENCGSAWRKAEPRVSWILRSVTTRAICGLLLTNGNITDYWLSLWFWCRSWILGLGRSYLLSQTYFCFPPEFHWVLISSFIWVLLSFLLKVWNIVWLSHIITYFCCLVQ